MKEEIPLTCGGEPLMLKNRPDATEQLRKDFCLFFEYTLAQMFHRTFLSVLTGRVCSEQNTSHLASLFFPVPVQSRLVPGTLTQSVTPNHQLNLSLLSRLYLIFYRVQNYLASMLENLKEL